MTNPFPPLKTWQAEKKKFGIPDKIIKTGHFGERMDKLRIAFDACGGKKPDVNNVDNVLHVLRDGQALVDEWLKKANTMKPSAFTDKNKAIATVEHYQGLLAGIYSRVKSVVDPLNSARTGIKKAMPIYRNAKANPTDKALLYKLWDSAGRQYIGQGMRLALTNADKVGYSPAVKNQLKDYDDLMTKWMNTMLNSGVDALAADPVRRKEFLDDMGEAFGIATSVLAATAS